jgi:AraC family transcriptional regulator
MDGGAWKGWNVKYRKGGRALCSLYPKQGYFLALVPYEGKSNAFEVSSEDVLQDVKNLIALRIGKP